MSSHDQYNWVGRTKLCTDLQYRHVEGGNTAIAQNHVAAGQFLSGLYEVSE